MENTIIVKSTNLDDNESVFFGRQLEYVKTKSYDKKFTQLKSRQIVPPSFEAPNWARTITYEQFDQVGMAKIVSDYAEDFRSVDVVAKEFTAKVKSLGTGFQYNVQEIREAQATGKALNARRATAARRAAMQLENKLTYFGDAQHGLGGFFNNPNVPVVVLPNAGTWDTLTPDQILQNLSAVANNAIKVSNGVESSNTMLLPIDEYTEISDRPRSSTSDTTIIEYFLKANPFIQSIDWVEELKDGGGTGVKRMIAYDRSPEAQTVEIPQEYEQFNPQEKGLAFKVPAHMRFAGVLFYYPLSATYANIV